MNRYVCHLFADCSPVVVMQAKNESELVEHAISKRRLSMADLSAQDQVKRQARYLNILCNRLCRA